MDLLRQRLGHTQENKSLWESWIWESLMQQPHWSSDWLEWTRVRAMAVPTKTCWHEPELQDPYAPAYYERGSGSEEKRRQAWARWNPDTDWKLLWETGNVPPPVRGWLHPTLASLRGEVARAAYRYLIRYQLHGPTRDDDWLHQLSGYRRDSLAGNYLLAEQILLRGNWSRLPQAEFCLDYLVAACRGQEAGEQLVNLSAEERADLLDITRQLAQLRSN